MQRLLPFLFTFISVFLMGCILSNKWSVKELPEPNISEEKAKAFVGTEGYHLSFKYDAKSWSFTKKEETNAQLNNTEIAFLFNRIDIGAGDQGLANLRFIMSFLPESTCITTAHCLGCQKNKWSEKIDIISDESEKLKKTKIMCDGGF
jgi:hypothetical protein